MNKHGKVQGFLTTLPSIFYLNFFLASKNLFQSTTNAEFPVNLMGEKRWGFLGEKIHTKMQTQCQKMSHPPAEVAKNQVIPTSA